MPYVIIIHPENLATSFQDLNDSTGELPQYLAEEKPVPAECDNSPILEVIRPRPPPAASGVGAAAYLLRKVSDSEPLGARFFRESDQSMRAKGIDAYLAGVSRLLRSLAAAFALTWDQPARSTEMLSSYTAIRLPSSV
ncbi:hypothetical protein C2857_004591 [Epichloe festucae Fl1]|uniref:Uncharacterized protein n=1 Tax=Epichloe festucae (strain Fl1) TaxID=877507 RepID=A0A7U3SML2_EPIFF|nr:hypothetical protein C2857_004591 [Epichloe festucae Fl1]